MKSKKAYTLAETLITLLIIAVIVTVCIGVMNLKNINQRDLIARFDITFAKLDNIAQMAMFSGQKFENWSADQLSLSNLACKKTNGAEETNKSVCLKKALMSVSNIPKDCTSEVNECINEFPKVSKQLKDIFPSLIPQDITSFTMPGGVTVLNSYLDSSCQMDIPVNKAKNGDIEYVKGCGFLLVDVNGNKKPNNLLISKTEAVDRFLIVVTSKGLVKSKLLDELAGCPEGTSYDSVDKDCKAAFGCPVDMNFMNTISYDPNEMVKQYPLGEEHLDCFEISCKTGTLNYLTKKCPAPCAKNDEIRSGGLWLNEGGELPLTQEKQCCIPIYNQNDLANINKDYYSRNRDYCLMSDITLNPEGAGFDASKSWIPIGLNNSNLFQGSFYGNGHIISNLYINTSSIYAGLFGGISGYDKVIENIGVEGVNITSTGTYTGGLAGNVLIFQKVGIRNVYVTGAVTGNTAVGGLVGFMSDSTHINNAYSTTDVSSVVDPLCSGMECMAGGIVGKLLNVNFIQNVYSIGNLTARYSGIIVGGYGEYSEGLSSIKNYYADGTVNGETILAKESAYTTQPASLDEVLQTFLGQEIWVMPKNSVNPVFKWQCKPHRLNGLDCCGLNGVSCP